jgi:hypothetical protein
MLILQLVTEVMMPLPVVLSYKMFHSDLQVLNYKTIHVNLGSYYVKINESY